MHDSIARALKRVGARFIPRGTGRHRACPTASAPRIPQSAMWSTPTPKPSGGLFSSSDIADPAFDDERDMVRPYVLLYEEERARQRERRNALALALDGIDAGPRIIHGMEVSA